MPLICSNCGEYRLIGKDSKKLCCSHCQDTTSANILPLFIVTGASGSGKTTVLPYLRQRLPQCIVMEKDLLYERCGDQFDNNWLRIAYSIAQGGRHTIITGTFLPEAFDIAEDRTLVGPIHFINLHCSAESRAERLRARPAWRHSSVSAEIQKHQEFARWLLSHAASRFDPPMHTLDTSRYSVQEVADAIAKWVKEVLQGELELPCTMAAAG